MASGPFVFILDGLADDIAADFAERSIPAIVKVGEWETFRTDSRPRVILGLGDFTGSIGQPLSSRYAPGLALDKGSGLARTLGASLQDVLVWVASPAPPNTDPGQVPRAARRATWALTVATLGAIWRSYGGAFPWSRGRWLAEARAATLYGAALQLTATFPLPIEDDPDDVISVVRASASTALDVGGPGPTIDTVS